MKWRRWLWGLLLLPLLPAAWGVPLYYAVPSIDGRVIDAETQLPVEGAVVVAHWMLFRDGAGGAVYQRPLEIQETTTDRDGWFHLRHFVKLNVLWYELQGEDPLVSIFKGGYEYKRLSERYTGTGDGRHAGGYRNPHWNGQTVALVKLQGTELTEPFRRKSFYDSSDVADLWHLAYDGCEWARIPRMILAMDMEKARLRALYPDAEVNLVEIDGLAEGDGCRNPRQFFDGYTKPV